MFNIEHTQRYDKIITLLTGGAAPGAAEKQPEKTPGAPSAVSGVVNGAASGAATRQIVGEKRSVGITNQLCMYTVCNPLNIIMPGKGGTHKIRGCATLKNCFFGRNL